MKEPPVAPSLAEAFCYWLRLGFVSFGGPAGQIAIMHRDLVEQKRWISDKRFLHALNYCMLLPGPEAQQLATYIGWLMHGTLGGLLAGALFVLPSLLILILLSFLYVTYAHLPLMVGILYGIKPAVVAIVLFAAYRIGTRVLRSSALWAIALGTLLATAWFKLPFPLIITLAAFIGWGVHRFAPRMFAAGGQHAAAQCDYGKAVIDDDTPTPAYAKFNRYRLMRCAIAGVGLWALAMLLVIAVNGQTGMYTQMSLFFTKAALLTFGGAYAVLPYVYQGAVVHYAWLTPTQMMDGLALGETTPGPLIMVVAYVGFVGGWGHGVSGLPLLDASLAACVVTFFTFLPSFAFIFVGAPVIESTKNNVVLNAPLTAISAAVVGVIVSLGLFFAQHVFWPNAQWDWLASLASVLGLLALLRWRWSVLRVIGVFALFGLLHSLI